MGYVPPSYTNLHHNTNDLQRHFNTLTNRYITPSYEQIRQKVSSFEAQYNELAPKKGGLFVNTTPGLRRDQAACISQLLPKLPTKGNPEELEKAQDILFGAIIYRYMRLNGSYDDSTLLFFFNYKAENNCTLFQILEREFEFKDRELDAETIAKCCEAYRAYLQQDDVATDKKQKVGDQFPYIENDKDFYKKLDAIILTARVKARPIVAQLQVISFVQTVAANFRTIDNIVLKVIPKFSSLVSTKLLEAHHLTDKELYELLDKIHPPVSPEIKKILLLSLPESVTPQGVLTQVRVPNSFPVKIKEEYMSFEKYLGGNLLMQSQYALIGAYVLALSGCKSITPILRDVLNQAIEAQGHNLLDVNAKKLALIAFQNYITIIEPPSNAPVSVSEIPAINYKCWHAENGYACMNQYLAQKINLLSKSELKETETTETGLEIF